MEIFDKIISDRGSKYAVSGAACCTREEADAVLAELVRNKRFAKATHNTWPCSFHKAKPSKTMMAKAGPA